MKPEAIKYEVLFFRPAGLLENMPAIKNVSSPKNALYSCISITNQAEFFTRSLICSFEKFKIEDFDTSLNVIPSKSFIHLSVGDLVTNQKTINPYFFLSLKTLN